MADKNSKFTVEARAKGFKEVGDASAKVGKLGKTALQDMVKEGKSLKAVLHGLVQEQIRLNKEMAQAGRGSDVWKEMAKKLKGVAGEASGVITLLDQINRVTKESRDRQASKQGRFYKGLLQGLVPEINNIKEGPGMWRQALGAEVGKRSRMFGGGMANTFTHGIGGIAQALQSIPGGGFLAAPMQMAMGFAQQNLAYQGQLTQARPFFDAGMHTRSSGADRRANATEIARLQAAAPGLAAARAQQDANRILNVEGPGVGEQFLSGGLGRTVESLMGSGLKGLGFTGSGYNRGTTISRTGDRGMRLEGPGGMEPTEIAALTASHLAKEQARIAKLEGRRQTLGDVVQAEGLKFGLAAPDALQMMAQVSQAGGGRGGAMQDQGMVTAAMAAQRGFGVGAETSGAFLQAGRRGGLVGGMGQAGASLTGALTDALKLGLQGSEITRYVDQIAQGIRQWEQTGMPINRDSTAALAGAMSGAGLGATRGTMIAQGLASAAQGLSQRGPQSPEELMMLEEVGGWKPGTGAAGFEDAQAMLESGEGLTPEAIQKLMKRAMSAGGGGAGGRLVARRMLKSLGVQTGVQEMKDWGASIEGGELPPELKARVEQAQAERAAGEAEAMRIQKSGLGSVVSGQISGAEKQQAGLTNKEIAIGGGMLKTMFNLEQGTHAMAKSFETLAGRGGPLEKLTNVTRDLSAEMPKLAAKLRAIVAGEYGRLMTTD